MTTQINLPDMIRGDNITYEISITDMADAAIDISGDEIYLTFKKNPKDPDILAEIAYASTVPTDANSVLGVVFIHLMDTATDIPAGDYYYDVQWVRDVSGAGEVVTLQIGKVKVIQHVTVSTSVV